MKKEKWKYTEMSLSIVSLFNPSEEKVRTITLYLATVGMFRSSQIHRLIATAIGGASVKRLGNGSAIFTNDISILR